MIEYELKIYIELASILLKEKVERKVFLKEFQLSDYEYNKHLKLVSELANSFDVQINEKENYITYIASNNIEAIRKSYVSFYHSNRNHYDENILLSAIIGEYLIWNSDRYITLDEISDVFGYSKSKLREAIKQARITLEENNINVENVSHHGLQIYTDNEFYFRTCLVSMYAIFSWMNIINIGNENNYVYFRTESYSRIIEAIDASAKESNIYLLKSERKKIAYSLIVQQQRINKGYCLDNFDVFENALIKEIELNESLELLTRKLIENLTKFCTFTFPNENEKRYIKLIILGCAISLEANSDIMNKLYSKEHSKLYKSIISYFEIRYELDFADEMKNDLKIVLNSIIVRNHIHLLTKKGSAINGKSTLPKQSPLLLKLISEIADIINSFYGIDMPYSQLSDLAEILNIDISNRLIDYKKPNIGITSRNSNFEPLLILNLIQNKCNPNSYLELEIIDFEKTYPENIHSLDNYDLVLCDQALTNSPKLVEYRNSNVNVKFFKDKIYQFGNYYDFYFKGETKKIDYSLDDLKELVGNAFECDVNKIVFYIKEDESDLVLQIGNIHSNVKYKNYVYLKGKINKVNIGFIYNLLFKIATDFMIFDCLYYGNTKEEINTLFNGTIA